MKRAEQAFGEKGGKLVSLLGDTEGLVRTDVQVKTIIAYNGLGEDTNWGSVTYKATPEMRALFATWQTSLVFDLLDRGLLKVCIYSDSSELGTDSGWQPFDYEEVGGLGDVEKAFEVQQSTSSNGKKVVIHVP